MKRCDGGCQRCCSEYYYMPDGKFFCYDCWRQGLEQAQRYSDVLYRRYVEHHQAMSDAEHIDEEIRTLQDKIRYEKEQAGNSIYYDSVDNYADPSYVPYNYAKVKGMERDLKVLYGRRERMKNNRGNLQNIPGAKSSYPVHYFKDARWIDKTRVSYFESVELPRQIHLIKEKERIERENQAKFQEEQLRAQQVMRQREEQRRRADEYLREERKLTELENKLYNDKCLTPDEQLYVAGRSKKINVLYQLTRIDNNTIAEAKIRIIKRFEQGENIEAAMEDLIFDKDQSVRMAMARCTRRFSNPEILQGLSVDKDKTVKYAALHNSNYEEIKSGCFIATACYGDYNDENVMVLRRFRDEVLLCSEYGRRFVRFYYNHSPKFADWLKVHSCFASFIRQCFLSPIVSILKCKQKK